MRWGRMAALAATTTAFFAAVTPAWATVSVPVTPGFPASVSIPATGLPASLTVANKSTSPDTSGSVMLTSISLVPACGTTTIAGAGDCPAAGADPGVFTVSPTGTGKAGTACANTTFTITIIDPATGQVSFAPSSPVVLTAPTSASSSCTIDFTISVNHGPNHNAGTATTKSVQTAQLGYATGKVGADTGSGSGSTLTTVVKAAPGITTAATASAKAQTPISDTAILSPAKPAGPTPTGTITFHVYRNDTACTTTPAFSATVPVNSGSTAYTSGPFTPTLAGTYRWVASYSGDLNNAAVPTSCGAAGETSTISAATPTMTTKASAAVTVGAAIADTATLSGGATATGTITFSLFGPGNTKCAGTPISTSTAPVSGNGTYSSRAFTTATAGTYEFVAVYGGDANNVATTSPCGAANESIVVSPPKPPPPPPPPSPPVLSAVAQSATRWREGNALAQISRAKLPVGTTFSFNLNETAAVRFAFTARRPGRRLKNGRCVARTRRNRHKPFCRRTVTAGALSFTGHSGTNRVAFQGRISTTKKLAPGTYTLVITAGTSTARLRFTIVR